VDAWDGNTLVAFLDIEKNYTLPCTEFEA